MTITADNAGNNDTLIKAMQDAIETFKKNNGLIDDIGQVIRVPCLAHVIQLSLKALIGDLKITAKNKTIISTWEDDEQERAQHSEVGRKGFGAPWTLKKVFVLIFVLLSHVLTLSSSEILLSN
jgi:hypothetical protein